MTDDQAQIVQEEVEKYLRSDKRQGFDIGSSQHFDRLVDHLRRYLDTKAVADDDLRVAAALCVLGPGSASGVARPGAPLLRGVPSVPPAAIRNDLLDILRSYVSDPKKRFERVIEFVIAYGCGKWVSTPKGYGDWGSEWEGAVLALVRALEPAVGQANRWLKDVIHVVGFPPDRDGLEIVVSDASMLALWLIDPEYLLLLETGEILQVGCTDGGTVLEIPKRDQRRIILPGAKAVWTIAHGNPTLVSSDNECQSRKSKDPTWASTETSVLHNGTKVILTARDEDVIMRIISNGGNRQVRLNEGEAASIIGPATLAIWRCTCGTIHCIEQHRLNAWDPSRLTLWNFVFSAIKGPQTIIQTGSFVQGMYFPLLAQEGM